MSGIEKVREPLGSLWGQVTAAVLAVVVVSILFALQAPSAGVATSIVAAALAVGTAAAMSGAILGFLFGIPRSLALDHQRDAEQGSRYAPNTNLEQISDWITKILVGLGLVQIGRLPSAFESLSDALSTLLGGFPSSGSFGVSLCVGTSTLGFVVGYLLARVRLPGLLSQADRLGREEVREEVMAALDQQATQNAQLLQLADRQLTGDAKSPGQDELNEAVRKGSTDVLVTVFNRAEAQRTATWRTDKVAMARTIPIFRALINNDPEHRFVRHFVSIGFALKDQKEPDFKGAIEMLDAALESAKRLGYGWPLVNWNRALARILSDPGYRSAPKQPSDESVKRLILEDLQAAKARVPERLFEDGDIVTWLEVNGAQVGRKTRTGGEAASTPQS